AVGDGTVLDRATVLVADGLIERIGPDVAIPADAWVVDASGLTLYPGLIDPLTTLGLVEDDEEDDERGGGRGGRGGNEPAPVLGPESRPRTEPWREAADHLDPEADFETWRQAGFTAAGLAVEDGFFRGRTSLIHLGTGEAADRVLARSIAQRVDLAPVRGRAFPSSLMGVIAYVDQTLLDTRHYQTATAAYADDPSGRVQPRLERSLDALALDLAADRPFWMSADGDLAIDRALALASDHDLRAVLVGGHGAYNRVEALADARVSVVLSLDWPEAGSDRDPQADTDFRTRVHRFMAVRTPQSLHDAGVPFAFTADGMSSPSQVFGKVRDALDAGLDEAIALRAMTLDAARLLGVDGRLGSIAEGKLAHLVLATAPPWSKDAEIHGVLVGGRYHAERVEEEGDVEPPTGDVSGTWALKIETPRGVRDVEATLTMAEDGEVSGELVSERGASEIQKGRLSGTQLRFEAARQMGSRTVEIAYSLAVDGETLGGTASAGRMVFDLTGERTAQAADEPATEVAGDEVDAVTADELAEVMALYQGVGRAMDTFAIVGATVYTVTGDVIENGTVVVADGVIRAVGADVEVPAGAETIDAAGASLIPGIVDAHSHIAIDGAGNEGSLAVTSMVTIRDVVDPHDIAIYRALAGGVTTVNVLHGSANPIGGGNAVLKLRWGQDADGMLLDGAPAGIKFALGENPKRSRAAGQPGPRRYPATRMGVMDVIRQAFTEADAYRRARQAHREAGGDPSTAPRVDRKLAALAEILDGERLVHAHCYRADEILQLLRLAEEFGFRVATLQHVLEGYKVADEIAAHGAGASTFSDWWGFKVEAYDAIPYNAAMMTERGVLVSINSDSPEEMRHLNQEAAKAIRWGGLGENEALRLITLNPAIQLGIDDRVGSIEVGKDADLVLYDGHPLAARSRVLKTFVDGDLYFDMDLDRQRQAAVEAIEARLEPASDTEADDDGDATDQPAPEVVTYAMDYSCRLHHHLGDAR
ncbi:MAG: amidohydrolase family protein, partial [Acidobacteriota bacterium]